MRIFSSGYWGGLWGAFTGKSYYHIDIEANDGIMSDETHHEESKAFNALVTNREVSKLRVTNEYLSSYKSAIESTVIGTGTSLQYRFKEKPELNAQVENWLKYWGKIENCEITGRFFREDAERFLAVELAVMNGVMVRHHEGKDVKNFYQFEILSMDTIDRSQIDTKKGLYSGIQTNKKGQITGVWIYTNSIRTESEFVSKDNIIICIDTWVSSSQYTNVTELAPVLRVLSDVASYTKEELEDARERAKRSIIISSPLAQERIDQQKRTIKSFKEKHGENSLKFKEANRDLIRLIKLYSSYSDHRQANVVAKDSEVTDLKKTSDSIFADLVTNSKQIFSKAIGYTASLITGIPESSYNQALKGKQEDEITAAIKGQKVINRLLEPIYLKAIEAGVILGEIDAPDYYSNKRQYDMALTITRKIADHIDPTKQNAAEATALENGTTDVIALNAKRNQDWEETLENQALVAKKKLELARKHNIPLEAIGMPNMENANTRSEKEDEDIKEDENKNKDKEE